LTTETNPEEQKPQPKYQKVKALIQYLLVGDTEVPPWIPYWEFISRPAFEQVTIAIGVLYLMAICAAFTYAVLSVGIVKFIGVYLANICIQTGYCNFEKSLATFGLAQVLLIGTVVFTGGIFMGFPLMERRTANLDYFDDRLKELRQDIKAIHKLTEHLEPLDNSKESTDE